MSTLTIQTEARTIDIELGDLRNGFFAGETTGGNVHLYLDGVEYGSLFVGAGWDGQVHTEPTMTLGQYDSETEEWEERSRIAPIPAPYQLPLERADLTAGAAA